MSQPRALLAFALFASACAGSRLEPTVESSSSGPGYAVLYPETLAAATERFAADKERAHALSSALPQRAGDLKPGGDRELLLRVVNEADEAGRSQRLRGELAEQRAVERFWAEERGPIAARVTAAAQKQLSEGGCKEIDPQPAIAPALRDGVERQLERRARAANEAHRTIDQHKARLSASSLSAVQRLADEIALSSQYAHVVLVEDLRELDRAIGEQRAIAATLKRALDDERAIQADPRNAADQRASQERVIEIEKSRAALQPSVERARAVMKDYEQQLDVAQREHAEAVDAVREALPAPPAPVEKAAAKSEKSAP